MNRPFYTDYVRHMMRFYSRTATIKPDYKTEVDKANWLTCKSVISGYSDRDREMLLSVYSGFDTLSDEVYQTAKKFSVNQSVIWDMMKDFERKVAKHRGLI